MQEDATPAPTATIEFIEGVPEPVVPDVKLTRSRDGSTGVATFTFDNPSFLAVETTELGDTTGLRARPAAPSPGPGWRRRRLTVHAPRRHVPLRRRGPAQDHRCAPASHERAPRSAADPTATCRPSPIHPPSQPACPRAQVTATFINGKPRTVKGVVVIKGEAEWDRFMRFMER